jgi:hypothetical protein
MIVSTSFDPSCDLVLAEKTPAKAGSIDSRNSSVSVHVNHKFTWFTSTSVLVLLVKKSKYFDRHQRTAVDQVSLDRALIET